MSSKIGSAPAGDQTQEQFEEEAARYGGLTVIEAMEEAKKHILTLEDQTAMLLHALGSRLYRCMMAMDELDGVRDLNLSEAQKVHLLALGAMGFTSMPQDLMEKAVSAEEQLFPVLEQRAMIRYEMEQQLKKEHEDGRGTHEDDDTN